MNLKDIVLKQAPLEEFVQMHSTWYHSPSIIHQVNPARITQTITFPDYHSMLMQFLGDARADRVSVNKKGKWLKFYARRLLAREIQEIARIAGADSKKQEHIELYFKERPYDQAFVKLKFADIADQLVCYYLFFPSNLADWYTWQERPALLKPNVYALLRHDELPRATHD